MTLTAQQSVSIAKRKGRERLRFEQMRQHAARGSTLEEVAEALGMSVSGIRNSLKRNTGSAAWPIKDE